MDPSVLQEFEMKLDDWLGQGYAVFADDIDGELRLTAHFVSGTSGQGSEREQQFWPMAPELVAILEDNGINISRALAGPRPWVGPHPEDWDETTS